MADSFARGERKATSKRYDELDRQYDDLVSRLEDLDTKISAEEDLLRMSGATDLEKKQARKELDLLKAERKKVAEKADSIAQRMSEISEEMSLRQGIRNKYNLH